MIRLLTVAAWLTMMGVVAIPAVGFGEANDPKERDALARALPQAQVPLARGLSASAREGVPLSVGNIKAIEEIEMNQPKNSRSYRA